MRSMGSRIRRPTASLSAISPDEATMMTRPAAYDSPRARFGISSTKPRSIVGRIRGIWFSRGSIARNAASMFTVTTAGSALQVTGSTSAHRGAKHV